MTHDPQDARCFVIAEAGVNHNGDLNLAHRLIDVAVDARADAVKFQTFRAEEVVSKHAPKAEYQNKYTDATESQLDMIKKLELPFEAFRELSHYCQRRNIHFMSTPFDHPSVDFLSQLDMPYFKIPSAEITNFPFLERVALAGKPVILSTGMSTLQEVQEAVAVLTGAGNRQIIILHCTSNYPADSRDSNLRAMQTMKDRLGFPVGYSDHTPGIEVALAAVALGACVIEKHFTVDTDLPGPDHQASMTPEKLRALVRGIRIVEGALGSGRKEPAASERNTSAVARRSLVAARDIPAGTILIRDMIAIKRPGTGLPPAQVHVLLGRRARVAIPADAVLSFEMIS